ncbi:hypothetical protein L2E82_20779 [Cichorium intybus]|uniref:Uncharacterized protein n=1 Tax=Cichorium intybus TaxID=13427 RepID=A0ACB9DV19_CICIN|nr:hypothetical protein L2E82_20779 [Cichorium intybus]
MSHHFREMREGDYMAVKGPKGRFRYQSGQVRAFEMIAGGVRHHSNVSGCKSCFRKPFRQDEGASHLC